MKLTQIKSQAKRWGTARYGADLTVIVAPINIFDRLAVRTIQSVSTRTNNPGSGTPL
jgi:hypothetical protein